MNKYSLSRGFMLSRNLLFAAMVMILITACSNGNNEGSVEGSIQVKKEEATNQKNKSEQSFSEKETTQSVGYIKSLSSDMLELSETPDDKKNVIMFDLKKLDQEVKLKLKKGQKVKVTHYSALKFSSPPIGTPIDIEVIEK